MYVYTRSDNEVERRENDTKTPAPHVHSPPPLHPPSRISGKSERNVPKMSVVEAFSTIKVQD